MTSETIIKWRRLQTKKNVTVKLFFTMDIVHPFILRLLINIGTDSLTKKHSGTLCQVARASLGFELRVPYRTQGVGNKSNILILTTFFRHGNMFFRFTADR